MGGCTGSHTPEGYPPPATTKFCKKQKGETVYISFKGVGDCDIKQHLENQIGKLENQIGKYVRIMGELPKQIELDIDDFDYLRYELLDSGYGNKTYWLKDSMIPVVIH